MAPYRPTGQRRSGRAYVDHDVFEGLPVRRWARQPVHINPGNKTDSTNNGAGSSNKQSNVFAELPMPKDAHLLCPMSQAILQAARAGRVSKPSRSSSSANIGEDGGGSGMAGTGDEDDVVGSNEAEKTFTTMRWQLIPRHLEGPEAEYLSKRRHEIGKSSSRGGGGNATKQTSTTIMKRATIKRLDTDGNSVIEEVLMAEGQTVDGEVLAEVTVSVPETQVVGGDGDGVTENGMMGEGLQQQQQPTPSRRRPPPPKRKAKGPGRGRKKKVQFMPGEARGVGQQPMEGIVLQTDQVAVDDGVVVMAEGEVKKEDRDRMDLDMGIDVRKRGEDTEIGDDANMKDGEEGEDDEEEGEELEDDDREEGELSPSPEGEGESTPNANANAGNGGHTTVARSLSPTKPIVAAPSEKTSSDRDRAPSLSATAIVAPATMVTTTSTSLDLNPTGLKHPLPPKPGPPHSI